VVVVLGGGGGGVDGVEGDGVGVRVEGNKKNHIDKMQDKTQTKSPMILFTFTLKSNPSDGINCASSIIHFARLIDLLIDPTLQLWHKTVYKTYT
jgi:hypothetical protein